MNTDSCKIEFLRVSQDESFVVGKYAFVVGVEYFNSWVINLLNDNTLDEALREFDLNTLIMYRLARVQNSIMKIVEPTQFGKSTIEFHECYKISENNKEVFKGTFSTRLPKQNKSDIQLAADVTSLTGLIEWITKEQQNHAKKKMIELLKTIDDYDEQSDLYKIMRIDLDKENPTINLYGPTSYAGIFEEFDPKANYYRYPITISDQEALKKLKEGIIERYITEMKEIIELEI